MGAAAKAAPLPEHRTYQEEMQGLRTSILQRLVAFSVLIGLLWFAIVGVVQESRDLTLWSGPLALAFGSLLAYRMLGGRGFRVAAAAYIAGVALSVGLATWAYPRAPLLVLMALVVGITSLLIGPRAGFLSGVGVIALLIAANAAGVPHLTEPVLWLTGILSLLMALLLWLALYPLRITLDWAWTNYRESRRQTEALREERGRMNRTLKDLAAAYGRLEALAAELERARRAALEAHRLKAAFATNVSHELRTPLNLIVGFSEMMALAPHVYEGQALPPAYRGDIQAIYHNARHLSQLIDDVLDLSQIEAGRMGLVREPVSLAEVIAEAVAAVGHRLTAKGLALDVRVPADLPPIAVDRTRLRQVFINLLNNAARFTDRGGATITAEACGRDLTVAVADTGIGIAEKDMPRLFEAFSRLEDAERHGSGSGLGLAISKKFVELHGGRMWVTSQLGAGTTLHFTLPLRAEDSLHELPPETQTWARVPARASCDQKLIILASDSAPARSLQRYLDGYQVAVASTRQEACRLAAEGPVAGLVLMREEAPGGWEDLEAVGAELPGLPMALCSLRGPGSAGRDLGVADYLLKPVTQERLLRALDRLGHGVRSLLIVDDDPEVVRLLGHMVRAGGRTCRIWSAYGGAQALGAMRRHRPGAVLLDLLMPEIDGYEVLAAMRADPRLHRIPVIAVTAKGREAEAMRARLLAFSRHDGLAMEELVHALRASLEAMRPPEVIDMGSTPPTGSAG